MTDRALITEITRSVGDSSFSMDELYYRFFGTMPLLYVQTGSLESYDRPVAYSDEDDEVIENPNKGPEILNETIEKLYSSFNQKEICINKADITVLKNYNFSSNTFTAFIVFSSSLQPSAHRYNDIIVKLSVAPGKRETMTSMSIMGTDESLALWQVLVEHSKMYIQPTAIRQDEINIIMISDGEFYLKSIPLVNHNQEFSYDFYNDNFEPVSKRVEEALQVSNESGLVLFHGNPGTGKTSYLKRLLHIINKKKLIYLPPDLIESLSAPNFISFLLSQAANSILLIEDAENVLKQREAGGNQAVSNILNISDGILGDILRLQIVCTFNSRLEDIDQALLRPGRLLAEYRFEKLTLDKTKALMMKLHKIDAVDKPMTLADIFNYNNMPNKTKRHTKSVGFIQSEE